MMRRVLASLLVTAIALVVVARAENPINIKVDPKKTNTKDEAKLDPKNTVEDAAIRQQRLAQQFREFEGALLRLAQRLETSSKAEDREKASILKKAIEKAMTEGVDNKFDRLVTLLRTSKVVTPDYLEQAKDQNKALADDIRTILAILLTDNRDDELRKERQKYTELLKRLNEIIRDEKTIRALTPRDGVDKDRLAGEQNRVAKATDQLARGLGKGDPKDGGDKKGSSKGDGKPNAGKGEAKEDTKEKKVESKDAKESQGGEKKQPGDNENKPGGENKQAGNQESKGGSKSGESKESKGGSKSGEPKENKPGEKQNQGGIKTSQKKQDEAEKKEKAESKGRGDNKGESKPGEQKSKSSQQQDQKPQGQSKGGQQGQQGQQGQSKKGDQQGNQQQNSQQNNQQQQEQLPARKKIEDAYQDEQQAENNIQKEKKPEAAKNEDEAIDKLTQAKKALEELLRQLREEEIERLLAQLQSRCERMLALQLEVQAGTVSTQRAIDNNADKKPSRTEVQKGLQLADREDEIVREANKAIDLLKTEGSAVAFPEVFIQIRSDMMNVSRRLRKTDTASMTQTIEQDIIDTLKEMIEALKKAQKDQQAKKQQPQQQQQSPPGDDKLIDLLAELKMIRSLQVRVNARTKAYSRDYEGKEQAPLPTAELTPDEKEKTERVLDELKDLADRQAKIFEVTEDIAKGRNK
jgi:hypothetical protein